MAEIRRIEYGAAPIAWCLLLISGCGESEPRPARSSTVKVDRVGMPESDAGQSPQMPIYENKGSLAEELAQTRPSDVHAWVSRQEAEIAKLLSENPTLLTGRDGDGWTALHWAVRLGNVETTRLLIKRGADIDARDLKGRTPLFVVMDRLKRPLDENASKQEVETLRAEMRAGFPVTDKPLGISQLECARLLLDAGADPNTVDEIGQTPAHWAVIGGHVEMIQLLARRGGNFQVQDIDGNSPIDLARGGGVPGAIRRALEGIVTVYKKDG